ncbi:Bicyclomycin resistance protein [Vibrio stylophorae]|uniref:Bcr/CflA family efflux transporter n=1 Tax=Vibrio stylophorae TaxID=659351 RepID=A0ABN8DT04_9VIBR|nr:Bcr/CflA family multidrug efflux MFS transporter [Vibrio stylophorae]CAH0533389.1 Bicyclomycin resistance protein [Vibrio stylophorae]
MTSERRLSAGLIVILGAIAALTPLAIDMYLPAMPTIARDLMVDESLVQGTLSVYVLGFALGQLIHGPISDSFGRRPVLLIGVLSFAIAATVCASSSHIHDLTVMRAVQGFAGAAAAVVIQAIVRDLFDREQFARTMSFVTLVMTVAPLLAPMMGGHLAIWFGWRAVFWFLVVYASLVLVAVAIFLPESLPKSERTPLSFRATMRNYMTLVTNRTALGLILCSAFSFSCMFAFLTAGAFVYIDLYGVSTEHFGYFFALNVCVLIVMTSINSHFVRKVGSPTMLRIGLSLQLLAGILLLLGQLFDGGLWALALPVALAVGVIAMIGSNSMACLLGNYPHIAGTASSCAGTMRFGMGGIAGAILSLFSVQSPWPMVLAMFLCALLSMLCYLLFARNVQ